MIRRFVVPAFATAMVLVACGSSDDAPASTGANGGAAGSAGGAAGDPSAGSGGALPTDHSLPVLMSIPETTDAMILIAHAVANPPDSMSNPAYPDKAATYLANGFGDTTPAAGEPHITRVIDGSTPPAAGANAKRILHFAHLADLQIADDESPTRLGDFDAIGATSSALRPQDADLCRMTNAAVRAIDTLHAKDPFAFTLLGGDEADSAQSNEIDWVLGMFRGGALVECDSGNDDDPVPGPDNDGKDPFLPPGLAMPWKWVTGNHDVLVQGNLPVSRYAQTVLGSTSLTGTRNYADGGINEDGDVVPDPRRALLTRTDLMTKIQGDGDGHGLGPANVASGRAFYSFDVDGTPLRFVILDTGAEEGGDEGVLHQADVDSFVTPLLDDAAANGKYVVLASHHPLSSLSLTGGELGTKQPDAVSSDAWAQYLGARPNVILSMVGHAHELRAASYGAPHAYWEVMTSAIADHPHEFRDMEIWDEDNGWLMIRATAVDIALDDDVVAQQGRTLGVVDVTSGWVSSDGRNTPQDRNVELWIQKPPSPAP